MIGTRSIIGVCIFIAVGLLASTEPGHLVSGFHFGSELEENINKFFGDDSSGASDDRSTSYARQQTSSCGLAPQNRYSGNNVTFMRSSIKPHLVAGWDEIHGEWPSFVLVTALYGNVHVRCGGVILSESRVLTAAHCVFQQGALLTHIDIHVGVHDSLSQDPNKKKYRADVACMETGRTEEEAKFKNWALLRPRKPIKLNKYVQPACLPPGEYNEARNYKHCFFVGGGSRGRDPNNEHIWPRIIQTLPVKRAPCRDPSETKYLGEEALACYESTKGGRLALGDAGGPVLCLDADTNKWTAVAMATNDSDGPRFGIFALTRALQSQWESVSCIIPAGTRHHQSVRAA